MKMTTVMRNAQRAINDMKTLNFLDMLSARWDDERDYEDWNDYKSAMQKRFPQFRIVKATKRPFGFVVADPDCTKNTHIFMKRRGDYVRMAGKFVKKWAPTGNLPDRKKRTLKTARHPTPSPAREVVVYRSRPLTSNEIPDLMLLKDLLRQCHRVLRFKWILWPSYRRKAEATRDALQWAIGRIERR